MARTANPTFERRVRDFFIWLSSASPDPLDQCPKWEQRKYVAFGATVLVPTLFALIAASYAVYTLTTNWFVIVPVALVWAYIILSVDRAILASMSGAGSPLHKFFQFVMRVSVAILMGATISHPLALLLFKDTIAVEIEAARDKEIQAVREDAAKQKAVLETRIVQVETSLAEQRARVDATYEAKFLEEDKGGAEGVATLANESEAMKTEIDLATADAKARIAAIDAQLTTESAAFRKVQEELNHWQGELEKELNGSRSGVAGTGPRAKSIQADQLDWRRTEAKRLGSLVDQLTAERAALAASLTAAADKVRADFKNAAQARLDEDRAERQRVASIRAALQQQQAGNFVKQQEAVRQTLTSQIDASVADLARLQGELKEISTQEAARVATLRAEPRRDMLTQTLALHHLFEKGAEGGDFALAAYIVLALLFMLVDTIPIVIKFMTKPGPYDLAVARQAGLAKPEAETEAGSKWAHDAIESSRKSVLYFMGLLADFEEKLEKERRQILDSNSRHKEQRLAVLDRMADAFYANLDSQVQSYFGTSLGDLPRFQPEALPTPPPPVPAVVAAPVPVAIPPLKPMAPAAPPDLRSTLPLPAVSLEATRRILPMVNLRRTLAAAAADVNGNDHTPAPGSNGNGNGNGNANGKAVLGMTGRVHGTGNGNGHTPAPALNGNGNGKAALGLTGHVHGNGNGNGHGSLNHHVPAGGHDNSDQVAGVQEVAGEAPGNRTRVQKLMMETGHVRVVNRLQPEKDSGGTEPKA